MLWLLVTLVLLGAGAGFGSEVSLSLNQGQDTALDEARCGPLALGRHDGWRGSPHLRRALPSADSDDSSDGDNAPFDRQAHPGRAYTLVAALEQRSSSPSLHFARTPRFRLAISRAPPRSAVFPTTFSVG